MEFSADSFRAPPAVDLLIRLFGQFEYTGWLDESMSWKETCYIGDWSFLPQTRFRGPEVLDLFSGISVNSFRNFPVLSSKHVVQANSHGKIMNEGILTRLGDDDFVYHGPGDEWARCNLDRSDIKATAESDDWFIYQVSGPASISLLIELTGDEDLPDVPYMHAKPVTLAAHRIWALRQGMAGELGFELQGPREAGRAVYDAVAEAGQKYGIRRLGARTVPINQLENAIPARGLDYLPALHEPEQAEYLASLPASSIQHLLLAFIAGSFEGASLSDYYRDPVELRWTRQMLSLAVLDVAAAGIGTQVEVVWGNPGETKKRIRATVAKAPFKPDRSA